MRRIMLCAWSALLLAPFSIAGDKEPKEKKQDAGDPVIAEYVNRLGQNLAKNSDAAVPISVKGIDSDEIHAFALPGGFLFVNTGSPSNTCTGQGTPRRR
jgi:hypothetical protein